MRKKKESLNKAKESWKKMIEWWKELWIWAGNVLWWTTKSIFYTLESAWEAGVSKVSKKKSENLEYSNEVRREYRERAEKYSKRSKESFSKAWKSAKQAIWWLWKMGKWWVKLVWNTAKAWYYLVDAGDKAIWEKISEKKKEKWENKVSKTQSFFRNNILKLLIAWSILWYGWTEAVQHYRDNDRDKIEVIQWDESYKAIVKELFKSNDVLNDLEWSGKKWQDKRENRYLGNDEAWNSMRNWFWIAERKKVVEWMCRMIESWDLGMVMEKADAAWVPRQCVFLALAESWRQAWADSGVAGWYWQFTKDSAKLFWLIDDQWNDFRADPEKSTDAAMKHLTENYKIVCNYNKNLWYNMSESDKRIYAFHMYNWSPKLVKKWIIACKWDANKYSEMQRNTENRNYVPRILGIQDALFDIFDGNGYDIRKIKAIHLNEKVEKTDADIMFEEFLNNKNKSSDKDNLNKLNAIKSKYKEEYNSKIISKRYYDWAVSIIDEEISSIE